MQRNCRFEIISVSREENFLPCSTEWDKSVYFTPSNLLPKSVVKMKHLTREQRYGISLMLQEGKSRKDIAKEMKERSTTNVEIHMQEEDTSLIVLIPKNVLQL